MRLELGNLTLNIGRRMNKTRGRDHIEQCQMTVPFDLHQLGQEYSL